MILRSDYRQAVRPLGRTLGASVGRSETDQHGVCRVRIYEPNDRRDHHVVLIEELLENEGPSTVTAMPTILSDLFSSHRTILDLETTLVFEFRSSEVRGGNRETLDQAIVTGWRVRQMPFPAGGNEGIQITGVEWRGFDRHNFEVLIGQRLA